MTMRSIKCGFLPLVDCAPLIIAKELTFAAQEGLDLTLVKQPSWSALRDKLALGHIDLAHMLSPMPVAMSLGLGGMPANIDALMVLSINGTVIGVSNELGQKLEGNGWVNTFNAPHETSKALSAAASGPLRIGIPFPFSMHRILLEMWLFQSANFDPSQVEIITVPPPKMAAAVRDGFLDMFCVGEPWGTVAVQQSGATLVLPGARIWECAPEKVLGVRHDWAEANPDTCRSLVRAIYRAANWLGQAENTLLAVEILARNQHLDLPDHAIEPALNNCIVASSEKAPIRSEGFLEFHQRATNFPWRSQAALIGDKLASWHGLDPSYAQKVARSCFRADIYRDALAPIGVELPRDLE
ncbi:CmpA/NrtA family ABC transporter substrate-binding protein [Planktotalea sp.]|uniref:CmpA/NrtA family ABC transporter substrate-binding protein n=1 Tax=Planktotalea sp. TaxID=2029877 RepID=UPI003D6A7EC8